MGRTGHTEGQGRQLGYPASRCPVVKARRRPPIKQLVVLPEFTSLCVIRQSFWFRSCPALNFLLYRQASSKQHRYCELERNEQLQRVEQSLGERGRDAMPCSCTARLPVCLDPTSPFPSDCWQALVVPQWAHLPSGQVTLRWQKYIFRNTNTSRGKSSLHARRPEPVSQRSLPHATPYMQTRRKRLVAELGEGLVGGSVGRGLDTELASSLLGAS